MNFLIWKKIINFNKSKNIKEKSVYYFSGLTNEIKVCTIDENKFATTFLNGGLFGLDNFYLLFYDIRKDKKIKYFKCEYKIESMGLLDRDNFIFYIDGNLTLIGLERDEV